MLCPLRCFSVEYFFFNVSFLVFRDTLKFKSCNLDNCVCMVELVLRFSQDGSLITSDKEGEGEGVNMSLNNVGQLASTDCTLWEPLVQVYGWRLQRREGEKGEGLRIRRKWQPGLAQCPEHDVQLWHLKQYLGGWMLERGKDLPAKGQRLKVWKARGNKRIKDPCGVPSSLYELQAITVPTKTSKWNRMLRIGRVSSCRRTDLPEAG